MCGSREMNMRFNLASSCSCAHFIVEISYTFTMTTETRAPVSLSVEHKNFSMYKLSGLCVSVVVCVCFFQLFSIRVTFSKSNKVFLMQ